MKILEGILYTTKHLQNESNLVAHVHPKVLEWCSHYYELHAM
jgi:hypothetical protein